MRVHLPSIAEEADRILSFWFREKWVALLGTAMVAEIIEPIIDPVAATVEAILDPIATAIETLFNDVTLTIQMIRQSKLAFSPSLCG